MVADANIGQRIHHLLQVNMFINDIAAGIGLISSLESFLKRTITFHMKFIMVSCHALEKKRKRRSVIETALPGIHIYLLLGTECRKVSRSD